MMLVTIIYIIGFLCTTAAYLHYGIQPFRFLKKANNLMAATSSSKDHSCEMLAYLKSIQSNVGVDISRAVQSLEKGNPPIRTVDLLQFSLRGEWDLVFPVPKLLDNSTLRIGKIYQAFQDKGCVLNKVEWKYSEIDPTNKKMHDSNGVLLVEYDTDLKHTAGIKCKLRKHTVDTECVPLNIQKFIETIMFSIPFPIFDPNGYTLDHVYIDGSLRISKFVDKSGNKQYHIFKKKSLIITNLSGG